MKRDLDLIREILIFAENMDSNDKFYRNDHYSDFILCEHVYLLAQAGFIEVPESVKKTPLISTMITRLTWEGHEFLANIKNDQVFNQVKEKMKLVDNFAIPIIRELASSLIKNLVGIS